MASSSRDSRSESPTSSVSDSLHPPTPRSPYPQPELNGHTPVVLSDQSPQWVFPEPNNTEPLTNGHSPPVIPDPQPELWIPHEPNTRSVGTQTDGTQVNGTQTNGTHSPERPRTDGRPLKTGSCYCGTIRLSIFEEPISVYLCHCIGCRKVSGAPFSSLALYDPSYVAIRGATAAVTFQNNYVTRYFCGTCGSMFKTEYEQEWEISIPTGILDGDQDDFYPEIEVFYSQRAHWLPPIAPEEGRFRRLPE
ncbi:Mss4-like protein [Hypoxylon sp. FL0890]|nr:Mss4-like protein [Hypoxylon sp. FL0890]